MLVRRCVEGETELAELTVKAGSPHRAQCEGGCLATWGLVFWCAHKIPTFGCLQDASSGELSLRLCADANGQLVTSFAPFSCLWPRETPCVPRSRTGADQLF